MKRKGLPLETIRLLVPERAVNAYRVALDAHALSVAWFDAGGGLSLVEAVRDSASGEAALALSLALAAAATGFTASVQRERTEAGGWIARARRAFPEYRIGRRFVIRGSHLGTKQVAGRIVLVLDSAMAFGSGEHASTRGCLLALERLARRRLRRSLDLGTGSGILALAAARLWHRPVLAIDNDPDAVRTARRNVRANGLRRLVRVAPGNGWQAPAIRHAGQFDLVLANILARPLAAMARSLSRGTAPGGRAVLSGLLARQVPMILAAHRRGGIMLARRITVEGWTTLILRAPTAVPKDLAECRRLPY